MSHCDAILKCTAALVEELSYDSDHVVRSIQLMNQARFYFATGEQVEWQIGELLQRSCVFADCSNDMLCKACSSCNLAFFQSLINDHKAAYEHSNKAMSCATDPCCLTSDEFVDSQEVRGRAARRDLTRAEGVLESNDSRVAGAGQSVALLGGGLHRGV
ncbi:hypothetical protein GUITHDRAFT_151478 [Guillardia theta CCMP2712]|uniref:Uncharacterized protein n=1 Tax=Guillardia theta (strain CCMP2712) TaxID=905079 RepID=L1JL56_GUITC|nr:hypothetical protein GUITHDRAFT_151478 [Guillardia theta CCMP2712]EKX49233.1 hypothetical protein GUITHDRAFT_151478 [Guillardia theta CCMP2712]|eukprot:XP_005836213.1 hypothetical protein GUITHDRAFT_151478 [Guillardia theta CCMP2712]